MLSLKFQVKVVLILALLMGSLAIGDSVAISKVGDRMLVEVNGKSFSQRQMEIFFLVRESLQENPDIRRVESLKSEWKEALKFYVMEMALSLEADRIGGGTLSQEQFERLKKRSVLHLSTIKEMKILMKQLQPSAQDVESAIMTISKIEALKSFKSQSALANSTKRKKEETVDQGLDPWINEVYSRTSLRYYEGALEFQRLKFR